MKPFGLSDPLPQLNKLCSTKLSDPKDRENAADLIARAQKDLADCERDRAKFLRALCELNARRIVGMYPYWRVQPAPLKEGPVLAVPRLYSRNLTTEGDSSTSETLAERFKLDHQNVLSSTCKVKVEKFTTSDMLHIWHPANRRKLGKVVRECLKDKSTHDPELLQGAVSSGLKLFRRYSSDLHTLKLIGTNILCLPVLHRPEAALCYLAALSLNYKVQFFDDEGNLVDDKDVVHDLVELFSPEGSPSHSPEPLQSSGKKGKKKKRQRTEKEEEGSEGEAEEVEEKEEKEEKKEKKGKGKEKEKEKKEKKKKEEKKKTKEIKKEAGEVKKGKKRKKEGEKEVVGEEVVGEEGPKTKKKKEGGELVGGGEDTSKKKKKERNKEGD
ncbi:hypothetical protein HDV00_009059 [Rhizophlyctis rosea]|nr:hypothetical protein HDV00_009059 [Rhizophlyctis rosea]